MTRTPPPSDWVVYAVVLGTVAAMMFGKYLMGRGDKNEVISKNDKSSNNSKNNIDDKS
ncbi:MAG: hypothetical protein U9R16_08030 [Campylobacterota bacterium]|nr:hypothetical protein [Campylobacterota bacterium]